MPMLMTRQQLLHCVVGAGLAGIAAACGDDEASSSNNTSGGGDNSGGNPTTGNTGGNTTTTTTSTNTNTNAGGMGGAPGSGGMSAGGNTMAGCMTMHLNGQQGGDNNEHGHQFTVAAADVAAMQNKTYQIQGGAMHPHTITITVAQFAMLDGGNSITVQSSTDNNHYHVYSVSCG